MGENMKLRSRINDLGEEIAGDIHHGECFYEDDMLLKFLEKLEEMKQLACRYYTSNQKELEDA